MSSLNEEVSIEEALRRVLSYIGEDPNREGLQKTPSRILRSWNELFSGYQQDPQGLIVGFDKETYSQMIILKNIELYSMCEHHMLPFFGKAHIGYIPKADHTGRVLGISKLARLLDIYARRLQIQERIGEQVTTFLMEKVRVAGAACTIEAQHLCMRMRGCSKQNSVMITNSLKGCFLEDNKCHDEWMMTIKG